MHLTVTEPYLPPHARKSPSWLGEAESLSLQELMPREPQVARQPARLTLLVAPQSVSISPQKRIAVRILSRMISLVLYLGKSIWKKLQDTESQTDTTRLKSDKYMALFSGSVVVSLPGVGQWKSCVAAMTVRNLVSTSLPGVRGELRTRIDKLEVVALVFLIHLSQDLPELVNQRRRMALLT